MNETFRISQSQLKQHRLWFALLFVLVIVIVASQFWNDKAESIWSAALVGIVMLVIAGFGFVRTYRGLKMYAANHALVLTDDAMLLRDGATERRIPYSAIECLKIRRYFGDPYFLIKCAGLTEDRFQGYESVDRLLSALLAKVPHDRVKGEHVELRR